MVNSPHFRGYNRAGFEYTRGKQDWREQIDIGAERPAHSAAILRPPAWTRLAGPEPVACRASRAEAAFCSTIRRRRRRWRSGCCRPSPPRWSSPKTCSSRSTTPAPNQLIKIIRYPGRAAGESDQGVGAHKDSGFMAVLLQDKVAGLQVEGEDGWIDAPPVPGTFVINVGEILEIASNGYLRANVHRVVSPPAGDDRLSVAFFLGARLDSEVPLLALPPHLAAEARGVTQDPLNPLFREAGRTT